MNPFKGRLIFQKVGEVSRIVGQNLLPPSYLTVPAETCPANLINDVSVIFSLVVYLKGRRKK